MKSTIIDLYILKDRYINIYIHADFVCEPRVMGDLAEIYLLSTGSFQIQNSIVVFSPFQPSNQPFKNYHKCGAKTKIPNITFPYTSLIHYRKSTREMPSNDKGFIYNFDKVKQGLSQEKCLEISDLVPHANTVLVPLPVSKNCYKVLEDNPYNQRINLRPKFNIVRESTTNHNYLLVDDPQRMQTRRQRLPGVTPQCLYQTPFHQKGTHGIMFEIDYSDMRAQRVRMSFDKSSRGNEPIVRMIRKCGGNWDRPDGQQQEIQEVEQEEEYMLTNDYDDNNRDERPYLLKVRRQSNENNFVACGAVVSSRFTSPVTGNIQDCLMINSRVAAEKPSLIMYLALMKYKFPTTTLPALLRPPVRLPKLYYVERQERDQSFRLEPFDQNQLSHIQRQQQQQEQNREDDENKDEEYEATELRPANQIDREREQAEQTQLDEQGFPAKSFYQQAVEKLSGKTIEIRTVSTAYLNNYRLSDGALRFMNIPR